MKYENYQNFLKAKELIKRKKYEAAYRILKQLYNIEPNNVVIKFEFAKILTKIKNKDLKQARILFEELLNTRNATYAKLELGRLELSDGNIEKARILFEELVNKHNDTCAKLELGRLEASEGNVAKARFLFEELLNAQNTTYAKLELGKLEASEGNIEKARTLFEDLLNAQNATYAKLELVRLEARAGNVAKARFLFEELLNTQNATYAKSELLQLSILENKYTEALYYLDEIIDEKILNKSLIKQYLFYIKYMMGENIADYEIDTYMKRQIINYDKDLALEHIMLHLDENNEKQLHSLFAPNINLEELFNQSKNIIVNKKGYNRGIIDKYICDMGYDIGIIKNSPTSFVEIVTICNTNNIITMYPTQSSYSYSYSNNGDEISYTKKYKKET